MHDVRIYFDAVIWAPCLRAPRSAGEKEEKATAASGDDDDHTNASQPASQRTKERTNERNGRDRRRPSVRPSNACMKRDRRRRHGMIICAALVRGSKAGSGSRGGHHGALTLRKLRNRMVRGSAMKSSSEAAKLGRIGAKTKCRHRDKQNRALIRLPEVKSRLRDWWYSVAQIYCPLPSMLFSRTSKTILAFSWASLAKLMYSVVRWIWFWAPLSRWSMRERA